MRDVECLIYEELHCPTCEKEDRLDSQSNLLECVMLVEQNCIVDEVPKYEDLFSYNIEKQIMIVRMLMKNFQGRKKNT